MENTNKILVVIIIIFIILILISRYGRNTSWLSIPCSLMDSMLYVLNAIGSFFNYLAGGKL